MGRGSARQRSAVSLVAALGALLAVGVGLAGCGGGVSNAATAGSPTSTPSLDRLILRSSQVGPGYKARVYRGGRTVVHQVTLDLCGFRFESEALRTKRLQSGYRKSPAAPVLSNEVVAYTPGGAQQAMQELRDVSAHCPSSPVVGPVAGVGPIAYRVTPIEASDLLPEHLALRVEATGVLRGRAVAATNFAIYQVRGNVLSATYAFAHGDSPAALRLAIHAAAQSAANLRAA
jgi:hypothetical protein